MCWPSDFLQRNSRSAIQPSSWEPSCSARFDSARKHFRKGTRLSSEAASSLVAAGRSGTLSQPVRLAWPDPDDWHEDDAAEALAVAAAGTGLKRVPPRQSRLDLIAAWDGVLHVRTDALLRLNTIDSLELFTLFHGQVVQQGSGGRLGEGGPSPHLRRCGTGRYHHRRGRRRIPAGGPAVLSRSTSPP